MNRREMLCSSVLAAIAIQTPLYGSSRRSSAGGQPLLGIDYYPEQTNPKLWAEDVREIKALGATFVRMAEFGWSNMEPTEGKFDFDWLEKAVDMFHNAGVKTVLGTPSAAPPPWLIAKYPEVMMVTRSGTRLLQGSRRSTCPSNATYRVLSARIAKAMVDRFAAHPGVIGWQIDNEPSLGGGRRCYCDSCKAGFRTWLRERHGSVDRLNAAWGTAFWSARYSSFDEISVPLVAAGDPNPGLALDYYRYQSDAWTGFIDAQVDIVRSGASGHFVTSNNVSMPGVDVIDPHDMTTKLDFFSVDTYPSFFGGYFAAAGLGVERPLTIESQVAIPAFIADAARSAKLGTPFMVMEQQVGKTGFGQVTMSPQPEPGQIRLWSLQNIAHGARGFSYFRWDTPHTGQEQYWHGLLDFDRGKTPAYEEIRSAFADAKRLGSVLEAPLLTDLAVLNSTDTSWAYDIQPINNAPAYKALLFDWYMAATQHESAVSVIASASLCRGHRAVLAPSMLVVAEAEAKAIQDYVADGGIFIAGARSGWLNEDSQVVQNGFPGALRKLLGVKVSEYTPLEQGAAAALKGAGALSGLTGVSAGGWVERLLPEGAEPLATWEDGPYAGSAAATVRSVGKGKVIYLGGQFTRKSLRLLLDKLVGEMGDSDISCPAGVELTRRGTAQQHVKFLLNHNKQRTVVEARQGRYRDRLTGETLTGTIELQPFQVRVLERS